MTDQVWIYKPQEDITTWELSQCVKAFINPRIVPTLAPAAQRHFVDGGHDPAATLFGYPVAETNLPEARNLKVTFGDWRSWLPRWMVK